MSKTNFYYENYKLDPDESSQKCCTKQNCLQFCKKFLHFMISRVGLMIVMIGYVLAGGLIFEALESDYEFKALKLSENVLEKMLLRIYKQIESNSTRVKDESFYHYLRYEIRNFSDFFTNSTLNGTLTGHVDRQWDFFGSVFYCVTLVSTIGYGHITCKTNFGKVFTIIYSTIGVPLMMLFLANIGSSTGALFRFFYLKIESIKRRYRMYKKKKIRELGLIGSNGDLIDTDLFADLAFSENKNTYEMFLNELALYNRSINLNQLDHRGSLKRLNSKKSSPILNKKEKKTKKISKNKQISKDIEEKKVSQKDNYISTNKPNNKSTDNKNNQIKLVSNKSKSKDKQENEAIKKIDSLLDQKSITDDELVSNQFNTEENINSNNNTNFETDDSHSNNQLETENQLEQINSDNDFEDDNDFINNNYLVKDIFETHPNLEQLDNNLTKPINHKSSSLNDTTKITEKNIDKNSSKQGDAYKSEISLNENENKHENRIKLFGKSFAFKRHKHNESNSKPKAKSVSPLVTKTNDNSNVNGDSFRKDKEATDASYTMKAGLNKLISSEENNYVNTNLINYQNINQLNSYKPTRYLKRNSKIKMLPIYNKKQLGLLYRQYQHERNKKVGVPVLTILSIMICYLFAGMFIFSSLEKWTKLDAFYFCFTTLLTIGFGDLIPGSTLLNKNGNNNNLYISALYIFVGLVLIAMSLNLVNHQIKSKIKSVARKIGLTNC